MGVLVSLVVLVWCAYAAGLPTLRPPNDVAAPRARQATAPTSSQWPVVLRPTLVLLAAWRYPNGQRQGTGGAGEGVSVHLFLTTTSTEPSCSAVDLVNAVFSTANSRSLASMVAAQSAGRERIPGPGAVHVRGPFDVGSDGFLAPGCQHLAFAEALFDAALAQGVRCALVLK